MAHPTQTATVKVTGRRVVATLIDGFILGLIAAVLTRVFGLETDTASLDMTGLSPGGSLALFVAALLYFVLLERFLGRTPGKIVTGIRVIDEATGGTPGLGQVILRTLLRIVDGLGGYLLGFIVVLANDRRRRLGDMAAKTLVVRA